MPKVIYEMAVSAETRTFSSRVVYLRYRAAGR